MTFNNIERLCSNGNAFDFEESSDYLFFEAMKENFEFQYNQHEYFRYLCKRSDFGKNELNCYEDIFRIPHLFVGTMKIHSFKSVNTSEISMILTSSGTAGQKTQAFFDADSLRRLEALSYSAFKAMGMVSDTPVRYFVFNYDRTKAIDVGTAWSAEQKTKLAPSRSIQWTIQWNENINDFEFDVDKWTEEIVSIKRDEPIRFIGFPAFIYKLIDNVKKKYPEFKVHPESYVFAGGGWKNHSGEPLSHKEFSQFLSDVIGLPAENVRDTYGMAEHGVPYVACKKGYHHQPVFSRIVVREPLTGKILKDGEEGMLHLYTPYNTAHLNFSVLSTDMCVLETDCDCGIPGTFISSIRRGGIRKHKGCAIAAQEILNKSKK